MRRAPRLIAALCVVGCLAIPSAAQSRLSSGGFELSAANYTVREDAGRATITVVRADTSASAHVGYIAVGTGHRCGARACTATPPDNGDTPADFGAAQGWLDFAPGVARGSFSIPIVDHRFATIAKTVSVGLFAAYPLGLGPRTHAILHILGDEPAAARDPGNPLQLEAAPPAGDPLRGARFFVDGEDAPSRAAARYPALGVIAGQPGVARFGAFSGADVGLAASRYLVRADAQGPGTVPMLATYELADGHCGGYTPSDGDVARYRGFIARLAHAIGSHRAVLFLELDALITSGCLSRDGLGVRERELHAAINQLSAICPHLVVYLDAGAADADRSRAHGGDAAPFGRGAHPGLPAQLDALRLDLARDPLRRARVATARRRALRHQHRHQRPRPAGPRRPRPPGQRSALQPTRTRPGPPTRARTPAISTSTPSNGRPTQANPAAPASPAHHPPAPTGPNTRSCSSATRCTGSTTPAACGPGRSTTRRRAGVVSARGPAA